MSIAGRRKFFFKELEINSDGIFQSEPDIVFPFSPTHIIISNDSTKKDLYFSFNGNDIDGVLFANDSPITFDGLVESKIWFYKVDRVQGGENKAPIRMWAWRL